MQDTYEEARSLCEKSTRVSTTGSQYRLTHRYLAIIRRSQITTPASASDDALARLRQEYRLAALDESHLDPDPFTQFQNWFQQARDAQIREANSMSLASVGADGRPSVRIVLLKGLEGGGFTFYTNYESRKGREFEVTPWVAAVFLWTPLERQVRIEGRIEKVSPEESDAYYKIRPVGARIGAWASPQSEVIESRAVIEARLRDAEARYGEDPPRPAHWGGYRIVPDAIEFWQGRENRLHDRLRYHRPALEASGWQTERLAP